MYIVYVYVIEEKKRHWVLLGVEIDPVCIWKGQRIKVEAKID